MSGPMILTIASCISATIAARSAMSVSSSVVLVPRRSIRLDRTCYSFSATAADSDASAAWEAYLRQIIVEDFADFRPSLVFVPGEDNHLEALPEGFDVLAWFLRDPDFAAQWAHYRAAGRADDFLVYERFR